MSVAEAVVVPASIQPNGADDAVDNRDLDRIRHSLDLGWLLLQAIRMTGNRLNVNLAAAARVLVFRSLFACLAFPNGHKTSSVAV